MAFHYQRIIRNNQSSHQISEILFFGTQNNIYIYRLQFRDICIKKYTMQQKHKIFALVALPPELQAIIMP